MAKWLVNGEYVQGTSVKCPHYDKCINGAKCQIPKTDKQVCLTESKPMVTTSDVADAMFEVEKAGVNITIMDYPGEIK